MALTINTEPAVIKSAYEDNIWSLTSDNSNVEKVKATLTVDSVDYIIYAAKIDSKFTFNIKSLLKSFRDVYTVPYDTTLSGFDYVFSYTLTFTEVITSGATKTSTTKNVVFIKDTRGGLTSDDIISANGTTSLYPSLTFNDNAHVHYGAYVNYFFFIVVSGDYKVETIIHKKDGTTATSSAGTYTKAAYSYLSVRYGINHTVYTDWFKSDVVKVEKYLTKDNGSGTFVKASDSLIFYPHISRCEILNIAWVNDYNVIDTYNFKVTSSTQLVREETGIIKDTSFISAFIDTNDQITLESFEENTDMLKWLKGIWKSRKVWLETEYDTYYPIEITNDYQLSDQDRNVKLTFKMPRETYD